ncbi:MAG: hypothetical protein V7646_4772, partial [Pseudonocardia sp.]
GGFKGSHSEYVRIPFVDHTAFTVPDGVDDLSAVFASDSAPTGWMGAHLGGVQPGDVVAVWGCGAVGQMAARSAMILGAERVIAGTPDGPRAHLARSDPRVPQGRKRVRPRCLRRPGRPLPHGRPHEQALTLRGAQQHGERYIPMLLDRIAAGELKTAHLATHPMSLEQGARGYDLFKNKKQNCLRAVFSPDGFSPNGG